MFYIFWMSISGVPVSRGASLAGRATFDETRAGGADAPLTEIAPAAPGDEAAALGFTLAWAQGAAKDGLLFWAAPAASFAENGAPHAEGLAQFGVPLDRLLLTRTATQVDALWAVEQALAIPNACVICTITPAAKALSLTATRRLLLLAEKNRSRCILLRLDSMGASAAWTRWRIASAPSLAIAREIGAPAFRAHLVRNRVGPSGASWHLEWNAHEHAFIAAEGALAGAVAAPFADRAADARWRRAG
jgi:protein ImuA